MPILLPRLPDLARSLRHRNFRLFLVGQGISLVGSWMQQVAMSWLVYRITGSPLWLGMIGCAGALPLLLLAPVAGVVSDRCDRKRLVFLTQSLAMIQAFLLAALALTDLVAVWQIVMLSAFLGIISVFDMTARQTFLLEMVPDPADLANAIALNSTLVNGARLLGPAIAGLTIALAGEAVCFLLNGLSYIAVLAALVAMRVPAVSRPAKAAFAKGLKEGIVYALSFAPIRSILLLLALVSLAGIPYGVLLPVFVSDVLHRDADTLGLLSATSGVGALAAAVYLAARKNLNGMGAELVINCAVCGIALMVFSFSSGLALALTASLVVGFTQMLLVAGGNTVLHAIVEEDKRGRVMSFFMMAVMGVAPIGSVLTGILADRIGAPLTVFAGGPICLVAAVLFASRLPYLRKVARQTLEARTPSPSLHAETPGNSADEELQHQVTAA
jgi:MFS family permease